MTKIHFARYERSEFYFLFRDTVGFQTDLTGSGTQTRFPYSFKTTVEHLSLKLYNGK